MKNTIKMNRENEIKAKEAAKAAKEKEEALKDIKPLNIVETLKQLEDSKTDARVVCDKDGNPIAVCGGKYLCESYKGEIIGAETQEGLDAIKARIDKGIHGDGLLHKLVTINGKSVPCVGATEEELDADILSAEKYSRAHPTNPRKELTVATMLKEAGYKAENLEQITVNSVDYLIVYKGLEGEQNLVIDLEGHAIVNLDNIKDKLSRETVKLLLVERLEKLNADKKLAEAKKAAPKATTAPKTTRTRKTQKVEVTVEIRPCGILLCRDLKGITLGEIINHVLCGQRWTTHPYGDNPNCPWLDAAREAVSVGSTMLREVVIPTTAFMVERIAENSPITGNNLDDLTRNVARIIYEALRDEPYFGMTPSVGKNLADIIAKYIIANSNVFYR